MLRLPLFLVGSLVLAVPLAAQEDAPSTARLFGGFDFAVASPTGEFAENVGTGWGIGFHGRYAFDDAGRLSLRGDFGFVNYGRETISICVTDPCRVTGDLETSNDIFHGGIGPELGLEAGRGRLYGFGLVGFAWFGTTSRASGEHQDEPFASSTNFQDLTFSWALGAGMGFRLGGGRVPVFLDLGARYHGNGEVEYLRRGDIEDQPDGSVVINPRRSEANLWTFRLGLTFGFTPEAIVRRSGADW